MKHLARNQVFLINYIGVSFNLKIIPHGDHVQSWLWCWLSVGWVFFGVGEGLDLHLPQFPHPGSHAGAIHVLAKTLGGIT